MRRREDIQVNVAGLRRNIKNLTHNYSDAQVKVREATSNDHWGPRSSLMAEIADLTYNVVAYSEIMNMIWKRLNDHGKNWRHVYKALLLLEYLIKTGSEKVAQQCKENIFAIETLRDFQYVEDGKDSGLNVREKAKQLVILLKDDDRLRNDRIRALKAKERFAQAASFSSDIVADSVFPHISAQDTRSKDTWNSCSAPAEIPTKAEIECARPQTVGEEELQLQLALAMSREEAEQEEQKRRSDDVRLQLALSQSEKEFKMTAAPPTSHLADLLEIDPNIGLGPQPPLVDPWGMPISAPTNAVLASLSRNPKDPWSVASSPSLQSATPSSHSATPSTTTTSPDPWAPTLSSHSNVAHSRPTEDPWRTVSPKIDAELTSILPPYPPSSAVSKNNDPWAPTTASVHISPPASEEDEFAAISNRNTPNHQNGSSCTSPSGFDLSALEGSLPQSNGVTHANKNLHSSQGTSANMRKTPQSFLGENSSLVNLDKLITTPAVPPLPVAVQKTNAVNPFGAVSAPLNNSMSNMSLFAKSAYGNGSKFQSDPFQPVQRKAPTLQQPLMPQPNPFLS